MKKKWHERKEIECKKERREIREREKHLRKRKTEMKESPIFWDIRHVVR
jgi:hypothetical protein